MGLDSISQATKQLACLSGGTPLDFAAFVGDEDWTKRGSVGHMNNLDKTSMAWALGSVQFIFLVGSEYKTSPGCGPPLNTGAVTSVTSANWS